MTVLERPYEERAGSEFEVYPNVTVEYRDASHRYWLHAKGQRVSALSVTSVLKVLDKPALLSWAEACGVEGALILERRGELQNVEPRAAVSIVRLNKLGADAKRDAGGDRGTLTHLVSEHWVRSGEAPSLADFAPEHRGYVQAMCGFLLRHQPKASSVERFVGSVEHLYAGRLDMRAVLRDGRDCLVDYKTNTKGRVYDEAHLQTRAYADAELECGNPPLDGIVLVSLGEDGSFEMVECEARSEDWLSVLATYRTMGRLRNARAARERLAKAAA